MTTSVVRREAFLLLLLFLSATAALAVPQLQDTVLLDDVVQEAAEEWYHVRAAPEDGRRVPTLATGEPVGRRGHRAWKPAGEVSKWKLALFGAALGAGGTVLCWGWSPRPAAVVSIQRRKSELAEMKPRAYDYEEEALRVSMVGHMRAPSAAGSRTTPDEIESA